MPTRREFMAGLAAAATAALHRSASAQTAQKPPNIVFILADDIGYGDLGCYGAKAVKTPNLDRLAREGLRFTDAHSPASVCTPTRYGFLTGCYPWRNPAGDHILNGDAPLAISTDTPTIPSVLKSAGYATGLVGKWHLGLGGIDRPLDYNGEITPGPLELGFDYAWFLPATGDRVPCVFIENRRVANLDPADPIQIDYKNPVGGDPTGESHPELLKMKADPSHSKTIVNGISRIGHMSGGNAARWVDEDMAETFTDKAVAFIEQNRERPFFLFFSPHDIHEPMVPNVRFKGTSGCGSRGDVIHQLDWATGRVLDALDRLDLAENTLVLFSSDNGGAIKDTYDDGTNALHANQPPNGILRGQKGDLYEGGHRVPLLARWPGHAKPGAETDQLACLVDMMATFAAAAGAPLPDNAGPDSFNLLPVLNGTAGKAPVRDHLVLQRYNHTQLGLRSGPWMFFRQDKKAELYNLGEDLAQKKNLAKKNPEKTEELAAALKRLTGAARTRP